jgi:hypothetical protein
MKTKPMSSTPIKKGCSRRRTLPIIDSKKKKLKDFTPSEIKEYNRNMKRKERERKRKLSKQIDCAHAHKYSLRQLNRINYSERQYYVNQPLEKAIKQCISRCENRMSKLQASLDMIGNACFVRFMRWSRGNAKPLCYFDIAMLDGHKRMHVLHHSKPSILKDAGNGLFATQPYSKGAMIGIYAGVVGATAPKAGLDYCLKVRHNLYVCAGGSVELSYPICHGMHYLNDPTFNDASLEARAKINVRFEIEGNLVIVKTLRHIDKGQEFYVQYMC